MVRDTTVVIIAETGNASVAARATERLARGPYVPIVFARVAFLQAALLRAVALPALLVFTVLLSGCYWTEERAEGGISLRIAIPESGFSSLEEQTSGTNTGMLIASVVDDGLLRSDREIARRFFADLDAETDRIATLLENTPVPTELAYPATHFQGLVVPYGSDAATSGTTAFSGLNGGSRYLIIVRVQGSETALADYSIVGVRAGETRTVTLEPADDPDDPDSDFSRFLADRYGLGPDETEETDPAVPEGPVYYDTFEEGFNTEFFVYDGDHAAPYVESGLMVIPGDKSLLYTRKFTLPVVVEGRGRLSGSGSSYPKLGVQRIPGDYDADCLTRMISIETRWEGDYNTTLNIDRGYWVDADNTARDKLPTSEPIADSFDFRMEVHPDHQLILINDTVYYEETHLLGGDHWWTFTVGNWFATTTSELEWLRVSPAGFGDFEGVPPPP
jgi:hypothetical protein